MMCSVQGGAERDPMACAACMFSSVEMSLRSRNFLSMAVSCAVLPLSVLSLFPGQEHFSGSWAASVPRTPLCPLPSQSCLLVPPSLFPFVCISGPWELWRPLPFSALIQSPNLGRHYVQKHKHTHTKETYTGTHIPCRLGKHSLGLSLLLFPWLWVGVHVRVLCPLSSPSGSPLQCRRLELHQVSVTGTPHCAVGELCVAW